QGYRSCHLLLPKFKTRIRRRMRLNNVAAQRNIDAKYTVALEGRQNAPVAHSLSARASQSCYNVVRNKCEADLCGKYALTFRSDVGDMDERTGTSLATGAGRCASAERHVRVSCVGSAGANAGAGSQWRCA